MESSILNEYLTRFDVLKELFKKIFDTIDKLPMDSTIKSSLYEQMNDGLTNLDAYINQINSMTELIKRANEVINV